MGRGGTLTHTISGIDIALWDILGKATGQPVGRLLGGIYRTPRAALLLAADGGARAHGATRSRLSARGAFAPSRSAGVRSAARTTRSSTRRSCAPRARRSVPTPSSSSMPGRATPIGRTACKWAMRTAEMLADYDVGWFEEALRPDALDDFCELRRASPVPIAGGEVLTRRQAFLPWLTRGALDIVQPDVTKVGGISEQRRIAWMADDFGVKYVGHGWNTALGLAADLQLAAAMPRRDLVEFIGGSPYVDGIIAEPFVLDREGYLAIPDAPGLGMTLDRKKLARYTPDPALLFSD